MVDFTTLHPFDFDRNLFNFLLLCLIYYSHVQNGSTALMEAARNGYTAIVQYLVERTTAQVNATNKVSHSVQCITVHVHWVLVNKHKYHW